MALHSTKKQHKLLGSGSKKLPLLGAYMGRYESEEDLYREYWNSEENAKRADDYIARLNAFTASIGEKAGGLTGGYGDRAIYNSFDKDELASLEKEYNDFMRPFLKYSNSENAAKLDEQILGTLSGAVDAQTAFAQGAKAWSVYENEADYDNQQENAKLYFDIYEMTDEEYEKYKESVKSDTAYGALEKSYKRYNSLYWYLENPEDNPRPDWYKGKSPDEMTSDEWRSAKEEAAREMYSYEEAMERARPAYEGKIERANAIREKALQDHAYNSQVSKFAEEAKASADFADFEKTYNPETYSWEDAVAKAYEKNGERYAGRDNGLTTLGRFFLGGSAGNETSEQKAGSAYTNLEQFKADYSAETARSTMSEEEKKILAYYESTDPEKAKEFYKSLEPFLNDRAYYIEMQNIADETEHNAVLMNVASIGLNLVSGLGAIEQFAKAVTGDKAQELGLKNRGNLTTIGETVDTIRNTTSQMIDESISSDVLSSLASMGYQATMSFVDNFALSALTMGLGGGLRGASTAEKLANGLKRAENINLAIMGSQAASRAMSAAIERGTNPTQAVFIGIGAGATEFLTEKIGLENLIGGLTSGEKAFITLLKQAAAEGGEEVLSSVGNTVVEYIIDPEHTTIITRARELLLEGASFEDAMSQAISENLQETVESGVVGAISGGMSGSVSAVTKALSGAKPFNKSELKTPAVSATETIIFNGKTVEIDSVASSDKSDITFNLKDGQTAKASELAFENNNTAELMTWLAGNFADNQIFGIYERYKDLGAKMNPEAFARGWSLAQDYARNGKKKTDALVKRTGLDELSFDRAYGQGKYEVKQAEKAADDLGAASLDVSYKSQRGKTIDTQVSGVASISGDTVTWKLSDGTTATTDALKQKNSASEVLLANTANVAKSLGVPAANVYLSGFPSEGSVRAYTSAFGAIYRGAMLGYTLDQIRKGNDFSAASMSEDVQQKVYELGTKNSGKAKTNEKSDAEASKNTGTRKVVPDGELTAEQREAKEYAAKAGYNVIFEDGPEWENGFIDKKGNIHISKNTEDPVRVVLIHELTHYAEKSSYYSTRFANPILDSQLFKEWLAKKGFDSNKAYNEYLRKTRRAMAEEHNNPDYIIDEDGASKEMLAKFCGEVLFADDTAGLQRFLAQMTSEQRKTFSDHIRSFIRWIKNLFADKTTKAANARIAAIEDFEKRFTDTLKSVESGESSGKSYSTTEKGGNKKITPEMSDEERTEILKSKNIVAPVYKGQADAAIDKEKDLVSKKQRLVKRAVVRIGSEFGVFVDYNIKDVDVEVTLSKQNLKESIKKGANPTQLAKLLPVLEKAIENSVGVEIHSNRYFHDNSTTFFENLLGGYVEGEYFVPIRFGLKHSRNGETTLYVIIDQEKIESEVLKAAGPQSTGSPASRSDSIVYSVPQIIQFVKSEDLLRYLPDAMLTEEQKKSKWAAVAKTIKKTDMKNDTHYAEYVESGNLRAAAEMVRAAAKAAGYTERLFHGTQKFGFTVLDTSVSDDGISFFATDDIDTAKTYSSLDGVRGIATDVDYEALDEALAIHEENAREKSNDLAGTLSRWAGYRGFIEGDYIHETFMDIATEYERGVISQDDASSRMYDFADEAIANGYYEDDYDGQEFAEWQDESEEAEKLYTEVNNVISAYLSFAEFAKNIETSGNYDFYANTDGLLVIEGNGAKWDKLVADNLPDITSEEYKRYGYRGHWSDWTTRSVSQYAKDNGYRGVLFKNIIDDGGRSSAEVSKPADVYSFFYPQEQIKSADPITYDDNGNVIPLSERFNEDENDIRYSLNDDAYTRAQAQKLADGEIDLAEFNARIKAPKENPATIANLTPKDASTTPKLKGKGVTEGVDDSNFYESVMESDIFSAEFKEEASKKDFLKKYKGVTNDETMLAAKQLLDEGGQKYVNQWFGKTPNQMSAEDVAVGVILMSRYQAIGDIDSSVAVAEKLRQVGTKAGQTVQMFSILGRFTADGMQAYAQHELDGAFEILVNEKGKAWAEANREKYQLTDADIDFIRRRTLQAAQLPEGRDKRILLGEIAALIQNKLPANKGDAVRAYQRFCMLLNGKTNVRNVLGNAMITPQFWVSDLFATALDTVVAKKTGIRTTAAPQLGSDTAKAFGRGLFESYDDFRRRINTRNDSADRWMVGASGNNFNEHHIGKLATQRNALSKALNSLDRVTSFLLDAGDRPFYEMWFINSLNGQMKANRANEPTAEMIEIATQDALQRTWQDDNAYSKAVSTIKQTLNKINVHGYGLGDIIIKFAKTPANLTKAVIDFSPVGLVKAISNDAIKLSKAIRNGTVTPQLQKKFVNSFGKGVTGTILSVIFYALAQAGVLRGGDDEDYDVASFEKNVLGLQPYSVKIGDMTFTYDWAQPMGSLAAMIADIVEGSKEVSDRSTMDVIVQAFKDGGTVLFDQSFMQSIQAIFAEDDIFSGVVNALTSEPSVYIPQVLNQIASFTDPYARASYESGQPLKTGINKVIAKIPGLRQTLPETIDVLGREQENQQYLNAFSAFASPFNIKESTGTEEGDEIYRLYQSTGDAAIIPARAPYSVTKDGEKRVLTAEERGEYQRTMSETSTKAISEAMKTPEYKELSDAGKAEYIKKMYSYAKDVAEQEVLGWEMSSTHQKYQETEKNGAILGEGALVSAYSAEKSDIIIKAIKMSDIDAIDENVEEYLQMRAQYLVEREGYNEKEAKKEADSDLRSQITKEIKPVFLKADSKTQIKIRDMLVKTGVYGTKRETYKACAKRIEDEQKNKKK